MKVLRINKLGDIDTMKNILEHLRRNRMRLGMLVAMLAIGVLSLGGVGCDTDTKASDSHEKNAPATHGEADGEHGEEIAMTPAAMSEAGIKVESVMKGNVSATFTAPGRVIPTQNGAAHVGTVIAGRITRLYVSEGSYVRKGTPLAEVEASDIGELKGEYLRARADVEQRRTALARQEKLANEKIGSQRSFEEAQSAYRQAVAAQRTADAKLRVVGITPSSIGAGSFSSRIVIRSPIAGVIARRSVVLGEHITPSEDLFEVINSNTIWVDAGVPPHDVEGLVMGGIGFVRGTDGERRSGRIIFISPTVSPESRTVTVRVEIDNRVLGLRPEMFVQVEFERSMTATVALAVPKEAIEQDGKSYFVYKEHEPNTFQRVEVEPGDDTGDKIVVRSGLAEGDRIAISGLFYLRSAQQKGELSEHDH